MFACIYCPDDKSLVVIGEKSKKLELLGGFQEKADVKLTWGKTVYGGTIVKIGGEEEGLSRFANLANKTVLKKSHTKDHKEILDLLYNLNNPAESLNVDKRGRKQQDQSFPAASEVSVSAISSSQTSHLKSQLLTQFGNLGGTANRDHTAASKGGNEGAWKGGEGTRKGGDKGVCTGGDGADLGGDMGAGKVGEMGAEIGVDRGAGKGGDKGAGSGGNMEAGKGGDKGAGKGGERAGKGGQGVGKGGDKGMGKDGDNGFGNVGDEGAGNGGEVRVDKGGEGAGVGGDMGEDSEQSAYNGGYRGWSKQRLPFNPVDCGTSLTSTWSLCTGNRKPPTPPKAVMNVFRAFRDPEIQEYISEFLQFHENQEEMWTDEAQNFTELTHPQQTYTSYPLMQFSQNHFTPQTLAQSQSLMNGQMQYTPQSLAQSQSLMNSQMQFTSQNQDQMQFNIQSQSHTNQDQIQYTPQSQQLTPHSQSIEPMQCTSNIMSNPAQESPPHQQSHDYNQTPDTCPPLRRSPRKHAGTISEDSSGMVRLLTKFDVKVDAKQLRKATKATLHASDQKAGYKLASKVVKLLFTTRELANSCGQGIRTKKGDVRPPLDAHLLDVMKEYITAWCRTNNKGTPRDSDINDAVTEQVSYARKQIKNA